MAKSLGLAAYEAQSRLREENEKLQASCRMIAEDGFRQNEGPSEASRLASAVRTCLLPQVWKTDRPHLENCSVIPETGSCTT